MTTVTVKIGADLARKLLADSESELIKLKERLADKEREVAGLRRAVGGTDSSSDKSEPSDFVVGKNPKTGRAPKGHSSKAIVSFLRSHKGSFWTQSEVAEKTGVSMSTAGRVLERLAKAKEIENTNGTWGCQL